MKRIVCTWEGPSIEGTAVTVLHFEETSSTVVSDVVDFFDALKSRLPSNVGVTVPSGGDLIDPTDGSLTGAWTEGGGSTVVGTSSSANSAAGVGACITWLTTTIVNGRRVRGRTFIVPLASPSYESDGTIDGGVLADLQTAASILETAALVVWHRPTTSSSTDGVSAPVLDSKVSDKVAFLSSRRD